MLATQSGWWQVDNGNLTVHFGLLGSCWESFNDTTNSGCIYYRDLPSDRYPSMITPTGFVQNNLFSNSLGISCLVIYGVTELLVVISIVLGAVAYLKQDELKFLRKAAGVMLLTSAILLLMVAVITLIWFLSAADKTNADFYYKQGFAFVAVVLALCGAFFGLVCKRAKTKKPAPSQQEKPSRFKETLLCVVNCGSEEDEDDHIQSINPWDLLRIALVAVAVGLSFGKVWTYFAPVDVIAIVAVIIGGWPIYKEALTDGLFEIKMTMELSMIMAIVAAMAIQEFETAVLIVFFVLIAEVLEHLTVSQGRKALKKITDILPHNATVIDPVTKKQSEVTLDEIKVGDLLLIKPGACIPVDGKASI